MLDVKAVFIILVSYVLGCFSTGYYLVRLRTGQDIRQYGSGSAGGRNVGRLLGVSGLVITGLGDLVKGAVSVWLALAFNLSPLGMWLAILAVVAGHIWPAQLGFRGGKGIATTLGAILVLDSTLTLLLIALFGLTCGLLRQLTLSGLIVVAVSPLITTWIGRPKLDAIGNMALALLILIAHRDNISRLLKRPSQS